LTNQKILIIDLREFVEQVGYWIFIHALVADLEVGYWIFVHALVADLEVGYWIFVHALVTDLQVGYWIFIQASSIRNGFTGRLLTIRLITVYEVLVRFQR